MVRTLGWSAALVVWVVAQLPARGQVSVYRPLGAAGVEPAYDRWNAARRALASSSPESRPNLPGLRSRGVEILTDAMLRKHPRLLKSNPARARELILRRYSNSLPQLRGIMAEAVFVDRHPEWGYVRSPNATQHDVTRSGPGQKGLGPVWWNGQIKFHMDGNPAKYAADMRSDYRAHRFFVPDDHAEPLKAYLKTRAEASESAGELLQSRALRRDYARVRPLGVTSLQIDRQTQIAARLILSERSATYASLGAVLAVALGDTAYDLMSGEISPDLAFYRASRGASMLGAAGATELALARVRQGAWRGSLRGNVVTGVVLTVVETGWLLHEHGWRDAFYSPQFYERLVGGVGAVGLGLAGFSAGTALASETGPWAPLIGTGVGFATGTLGYVGGQSASRIVIETFAPEMLRKHERTRIAAVKSHLEDELLKLRSFEQPDR